MNATLTKEIQGVFYVSALLSRTWPSSSTVRHVGQRTLVNERKEHGGEGDGERGALDTQAVTGNLTESSTQEG